jgi:hypothetical protein
MGRHVSPSYAEFNLPPTCFACLETANPSKGGDAKPWAYRDHLKIAKVARLPKGPPDASPAPRCGTSLGESVFRHTEKRERPMLFFKRLRSARRASHPHKACLRLEQLESRFVLSQNPSGVTVGLCLAAVHPAQTSSSGVHTSAVPLEGGFGNGWSGGQHGAGRSSSLPQPPSGKVTVGSTILGNSTVGSNQVVGGIPKQSTGGFGSGWGGGGH